MFQCTGHSNVHGAEDTENLNNLKGEFPKNAVWCVLR